MSNILCKNDEKTKKIENKVKNHFLPKKVNYILWWRQKKCPYIPKI